MGSHFDQLERYEPPIGDEPLDAVELAFVRALVPVIAERIREELAQERQRVMEEHGTPRDAA